MDVESCQTFSEQLRIFHITKIVTAPDQKENFHVENDEKNDVGQGRQNEEEVTTLHRESCTSEPIMYWMWFIVCEKSSMLHSDKVSSDILAEKTKLGWSMILTS